LLKKPENADSSRLSLERWTDFRYHPPAKLCESPNSHAKNRRRRRFLPNLHTHRFWVAAEKRFVSLRVSSNGMRIIDKRGIDAVLGDLRARGEKV